jgi:hypothetical protein
LLRLSSDDQAYTLYGLGSDTLSQIVDVNPDVTMMVDAHGASLQGIPYVTPELSDNLFRWCAGYDVGELLAFTPDYKKRACGILVCSDAPATSS